jgi:hypothetical protein
MCVESSSVCVWWWGGEGANLADGLRVLSDQGSSEGGQ